MREIYWTPDGVDSLNELLDYYHDRAGENVANNIHRKKYDYFVKNYFSL